MTTRMRTKAWLARSAHEPPIAIGAALHELDSALQKPGALPSHAFLFYGKGGMKVGAADEHDLDLEQSTRKAKSTAPTFQLQEE